MTEAEWLASSNLDALLEPLSRKRTQTWLNRKLRLFGCICCRRIWHLLTDDRDRRAVEVAEQFAEGLAGLEDLQTAEAGVREVARPENNHRSHYAYEAVLNVLYKPLKRNAEVAAGSARFGAYGAVVALTGLHPAVPAISAETRPGWPVWIKSRWRGAARVERLHLVRLLRDIVGNPFRKGAFHPEWQTPVVLQLAEEAYRNRLLPDGTLEPDRLAVLSDALEESGCTDTAILEHLRSPGPHVRGCWALDLVLGRM